jgi:flagellin
VGVGTINHNVASLNALRNLQRNDRNMNVSLERLSSGLRINRAADDAAGLAVSEKMRGQISGIRQSKRNAQDGISMIQTGEGVLDTMHSILQRMRVLAVQAANDSYTTSDREQIQKEMNQLVDEVDRVANFTEFNTKKLLNGNTLGHANAENRHVLTATVNGHVTNADYSITILDAGTACNIHGNINLSDKEDADKIANLRDIGVVGTEELQVKIDNQTRIINLSEDDTLSDVVYKINSAHIGIRAGLDMEGNDLTLTSLHSGSRFNISFGDDPDGLALKLGLTGGVDGTLTDSNVALDSQGNIITDASGRAHPLFTSGTDTIISITNITSQSQFATNPGSETEPGGFGQSLGVFRSNCKIFGPASLSHPINTVSTPIISPAWQDVNGDGTIDGNDVVDLTSSDLLKGITINIDEDIDHGVLQQTDDDDSESDFTKYWPNPNGTDALGNFAPGDPNGVNKADISSAVPDNHNLGLASNNTISLTSTRLSVRDTSQKFHIGPNADQTIDVDFGNLSAESLGLVTQLYSYGNKYDGVTKMGNGAVSQNYKLYLSVQTQDSAEQAITTIDNALNYVSGIRSTLGAYQNTLEKAVDYLEIANENMTASESRIRDVDMASQMSEFTKEQILAQSGTAMLAQANSKPQGILQLLR